MIKSIFKMKIYCMDVECAASGPGHHDRVPVRVALADETQIFLNEYILPEGEIFNYLTPLTGITKNDMNDAITFEEARKRIISILTNDDLLPLLVGASVNTDITWMNLIRGEHYHDTVEISEMFKAYNSRYGQWNKFSLAHICQHAIGKRTSATHDPGVDAQLTMELYMEYKDDVEKLSQIKKTIIGKRAPLSFSKQHDWNYQGVCMAAFMPDKCRCGQRTLRS